MRNLFTEFLTQTSNKQTHEQTNNKDNTILQFDNTPNYRHLFRSQSTYTNCTNLNCQQLRFRFYADIVYCITSKLNTHDFFSLSLCLLFDQKSEIRQKCENQSKQAAAHALLAIITANISLLHIVCANHNCKQIIQTIWLMDTKRSNIVAN